MTHYEDERLVELLSSGIDLESDEHLASCEECCTRLDSFRMVAGVLKDPSVWDDHPLNEDPIPATIASLRAFADQMTAEDTAAALAVEALLATPSDTWSLDALPRTAGSVRKLIEASERAIDTLPTDAVTLASLATTLAASLDPSSYASDTVPRIRGAAERQRAYALFYTGSFAAAEEAICASERHFNETVVDEYEMARVGIVRALVDRGLEKYERAVATARSSSNVFAIYEDIAKLTAAALAEVHLLCSSGDFATALSKLKKLDEANANADLSTRAFILNNLGHCSWKLGQFAEALQYHETASLIFAESAMRPEAVRARWNIASILAAAGRLDEALARLDGVVREFDELGMTGAATLAQLEAAEIYLSRGDHHHEVEEICQRAMRSFETAGLTHTSRALVALAFMSEAARNRTATPKFVREVREYIRRLPEEPNLLFAPSPA